MSKSVAIFNYHEKDVLLHVLFEQHPVARKIMEKLIHKFELTDFGQPFKEGSSNKKTLIDLFLGDKERLFIPLKPFYPQKEFGLADCSSQENALLETGVFYTIGKLLLVKCYYRKGLNKLMYASTIPGIPEKFKPLYLFRLGGIYLEQGMMAEAGDILELAIRCCRRYSSDKTMQKLEELILYQILRIYVIQENFTEARKIINTLKKLIKEKDNIIFLSLLGYFYRRRREHDKAFELLNRCYTLYKNDEKIKHEFPRQWFNTLYQLTFNCLQTGQLFKAEVFIQEAKETLIDQDFRNYGYCENLLGQIEMDRKGGDPATALKHFMDAYHSFEQYNDYRNMARSRRSIGWVYFKLKNYTGATQAYNQSLAYDYRTQIKVGILRTLLAKMELRFELVQYNKVEEYLQRIEELNVPATHYLQKEVKKYKRMLREKRTPSDKILGKSDALKKIKEKVLKYSKRSDPVLILGESGVGKNVIAEAIHKNSPRAGPLVHIECTSIPITLPESELFGYEKGAFTGALKTHKGLFEKAKGGTLFLDEIGDFPLELQGKLLHFFDKKTIRRVGGTQDIKLDVRVICATNKELKKEVAMGNFRKDLYYRISDIRIHIPPLRDRKEDIKELAECFYVKYCAEYDKNLSGINQDALSYIQEFDWPGNVRELEIAIKRSIDELEDGQQLSKESLEEAIIYQESPHEEKSHGELQKKHLEIPEAGDDLKKLVQSLVRQEFEKLRTQQGATRLTDKKKVLNDLFLLIQQEGPIRKSQIIEKLSYLEKSFHHWIIILRDKHQLIETEKTQNYLLYKPVSGSILKKKEKEGKLVCGDDNFYRLV